MRKVDIQVFKGIAPRVSPAILEPGQGVEVIGETTSGELRPWRSPLHKADCEADTMGIYLTPYGDWLYWDEPVSACPSPTIGEAFGRIYYTLETGGLFAAPKYPGGGGTEYIPVLAGVPKPASPVTVTIGGSGSGTVQDRVYVYTYVNAWGEEGPPSDPSDFKEWQPGKSCTLSNFVLPAAPLAHKNITAIRIYRMAIGDVGADWFFVTEVAYNISTFVDTVAEIALGEVLSTADYDLPQAGAKGLTSMGMGVLATFDGNEIAFSEPHLPYAWPQKYRISIAGGVVALGVAGSGLVVLTSESPYYVYGTHPSVFVQSKQNEITPCVSPYGVVSSEFGAIFPAVDGLRILRDDNPSKLITEHLLTAKEWLLFDPLTIRAAYYDGNYFGFSKEKSFSFNIRTGVMSLTGINADSVFTDGMAMFISRNSGIWEWEGAQQLTKARFKSKIFRFQSPINMSMVRIDSAAGEFFIRIALYYQSVREQNENIVREPLDLSMEEILMQSVAGDNLIDLPSLGEGAVATEVKVYADGLLMFKEMVPSTGFLRLPSGFMAREWQIEVETAVQIKQISMGTSVEALIST
jgi:hypothetical protein